MTHLLRGLFRLQTLEDRTLAQINGRAQLSVYEHALEFSLAYRVGLAACLNLPGQPRAMSSPLNVEVSQVELDQAYQAVMRIEGSSAFPEWCIGQRFWVEFLESAHPDAFALVYVRTSQALVRLEEQTELARDQAAVQMNAIHDNFRNERQALIRQLTDQALARHPANELASSDTEEEGSTP
ncbi:NEL domain-containing protein [Pseudomonas sp. B21-051]|uniref:NEL domain-containing protein n=1 Tax=Pseudomonas sp. B21-051 TaxID=2895491 RepID=UPI00215E3DB8|nr:NEL domain-containing protein [Pseudomonas sp. B21-051]